MGAIFIVEGWSDDKQLKGALGTVSTIVTNGTKMNNKIKDAISEAIEAGLQPYTLSDPDPAGDQLAIMISKAFPEIPRIKIDPEKAKYYRGKGRYKYGVEYCSHKYIRELIGEII
ncbi:putative primase [Bacillus phage P59]|nr:putative primase [Bacillus phage P59]